MISFSCIKKGEGRKISVYCVSQYSWVHVKVGVSRFIFFQSGNPLAECEWLPDLGGRGSTTLIFSMTYFTLRWHLGLALGVPWSWGPLGVFSFPGLIKTSVCDGLVTLWQCGVAGLDGRFVLKWLTRTLFSLLRTWSSGSHSPWCTLPVKKSTRKSFQPYKICPELCLSAEVMDDMLHRRLVQKR